MILLEKLNDVLDKINKAEKEQAFLELALYTKGKNEIKESKLESEKRYHEDQANYYGRNINRSQDVIVLNTKLYEVVLSKILYVYDCLIEEVIIGRQSILNNQKIIVGNIIYYAEKYDSAESEEEKEQYSKEMSILFEKIDDLEDLIKYCDSKIEYLLSDMQKYVNETFENRGTSLALQEKNMTRFFRSVKNIFVGKRNYKLYSKSYIDVINNLSQKISNKIDELASLSIKMNRQIRKTKRKILDNA